MNFIIPEQRSINEDNSCWIRHKNETTEYYNRDYYDSDLTRKEDNEDEKKNHIIDEIMKELDNESFLYQQFKWGTKKFDFDGEELQKEIEDELKK